MLGGHDRYCKIRHLGNLTMASSQLKLLTGAALLFMAASCGSSNGGNRGNRPERGNSNSADASGGAPIAITVGKSEARMVASVVRATGSLIADETSDIAPKIAGKISNVYVNVGQFVSQGTTIAKIDDSTSRIQLATSEAAVKQAQAAVRQAEAKLGLSANGSFDSSAIPEVRAANANYQQSLAEQRQAENNEQRYKELVESGDVAMVTYEQYRLARDTARAKTNNARELLNAAVNTAKQNNQAIASAKASVESAQAQVAQARQNIADSVVKAPFSGYISSRPAAVGEFISTASIVATILKTNPIKAQIQVAEADVPAATIGSGVAIEVDAYKDRKFAGIVSAINPAVDVSSRSAVVEALVSNDANALRTGMFVTAQINRAGGSNGIFVPKTSVARDPTTNNYKVFTVADGVAHLKVVQLGSEEADSYQVLSGVDADQTVATSNLDQLYEGAKVAF